MQESHLSSDFTFRIPGYKTLQMNRSMTRRETTNSTGNLGSVVLILFKNGLTYTSLSTQSLSSLDPSSDYLAIAVKIKRASPIHLFNVYVPPIRSSFDSRPKSFLPFFLPSSSTTYIFGDFNSHHSSWDSHSPEDQSGKYLFDWLLSSDLLPINNPEHYTLLHRATGNRSYPDLSLVPAQIASKCTWQTLPDLGSDHLPISIAIPTSPIINSFHRPPSFNYNKALWYDYLTYIDTHCDLIFIQESHLSSDSTFRIPGYKTLQKNQKKFYDEKRNHQLYGKPRRRCSDTCQKRSILHFTLHTIPLLPRPQLRLFSYRSKNKRCCSHPSFQRLCPFYPLLFLGLSPKILLTLSPTIIPYHLHLWRL